ncbi:MAG: prepilin peptidase [Rhodospirillales bacterium]
MFGLISIDLFVITLFLGLLGLAVVSDIESLRIPNRISLAIAALYPVHVLAGSGTVDWPGAVAVAAGVFALGLVAFAVGAVGGGDVKLMAATALWAGPAMVLDFVLATTAVGGGVALAMLTRWRFVLARFFEGVGGEDIRDVLLGRAVPYAVAIAAGAYLTIGPRLLGG